MIKYVGAGLLGLMSFLWWTGYEPFAQSGERLQGQQVKRGSNGTLIWVGGMHGGK